MKALPCLCGRVAKCQLEYYSCYRGIPRKYECTCNNVDCKVGSLFGVGRKQKTRKEAIAAWNKFITEKRERQ